MPSRTLIIIFLLSLITLVAVTLGWGGHQLRQLRVDVASNQQRIATLGAVSANNDNAPRVTPVADGSSVAASVSTRLDAINNQLQSLQITQQALAERLNQLTPADNASTDRSADRQAAGTPADDRTTDAGAPAYARSPAEELRRFRSHFETQVVDNQWSEFVQTELTQNFARLFPRQPLLTQYVDCRERGCQLEVVIPPNAEEEDIQDQIIDALPDGFNGFSFFPINDNTGQQRIVVYIQKAPANN